MKKSLSFILLIIFLFSCVSCNNTSNFDIGTTDNDIASDITGDYYTSDITSIVETEPEYDFTIDYEDAKSFEKALNDGKTVNNKIVQFDVIEYKPDSALGINCWSGEHLNFISNNELDVKKGDIIIGQIIEEPTEFLGSWEILYKPLVVDGDQINTPSNPSDDKENNTSQEPESSAPSPVFYSTNDYETAKNGNVGVFSYKKRYTDYDVYWIVDLNEGYAYNFFDGDGSSTCDKYKISSGNLNDRVILNINDAGYEVTWYLHFKYKNAPETLVLNEHLGLDPTEYSTTRLSDALNIRNTKSIRTY